jgi:hypothetical protein
MSAHRRRAAALLLLAAVCAAVLVAPFAPHTDDGCQTEVHCLACRTAVAGKAATTVDPGVSVALVLVGLAAADHRSALSERPVSVAPSRGPPANA